MGPVRKTIQDNYEILDDIGKGGMARVCKANQLSLGRIVAIKEIKPAFAATPELVERFKREARTAAALVHENIVQVYNFGEPQPGEFFIVMEFVDGHDLRTILKKCQTLPPRVAAIIARGVARALDYAHNRGLIHRDVKPGNVMITAAGDIKLMDFGIVKEIDSDLTKTGALLGTPNYMAPEQFLGDEITPATDIYSLGVVLYEVLTGQKPFKADSEGSLAKKVRTQKPPTVRSQNPGVSRRLQAIVQKCMAKNPRRRPQSARALISELEKFMGRKRGQDWRRELAAWMIEIETGAGPAPAAANLEPGIPPEPEKKRGRPPPDKSPRFDLADDEDEGKKPFPKEPAWTKAPAPPTAEGKRPRKKEEAPAPGDDAEDQALAGDVIVKWVWRAILLAIALLAAVIVFLLLPGDDAGASGLGPSIVETIKNFFQR